jgi:hypothetical protein
MSAKDLKYRPTAASVVLFFAGGAAAFIGLSLLIDPRQFYAAYGFELGTQPSLSSEIRGAAGHLASAASVMVVGAFSVRRTSQAAAIGAILYLGYAGGRTIGLFTTGLHHPHLIYAAVAELALGLACVWVYRRSREARTSK